MPVASTNLVSIDSSGACAGSCSDGRTFLASSDRADARARCARSGHRQLIFVFLPECAPVTTMASRLRGRGWQRKRQSYEHQKNGEKLLHTTHANPLLSNQQLFRIFELHDTRSRHP